MNEFVDVAVPVGVRKTFSYSVPAQFRDRMAAGMRVLVPFGRKMVTGYVIRILEHAQVDAHKLKAVQDLLDSKPAISSSLVETALWIAQYYFAPPGDVFRAIFPAGTQISGERRVSLAPKAATLLEGGLRPVGLKPQEEAMLDLLAKEKSLTVKELINKSGVRGIETWIASLASAQWIQVDTFLEKPRVKAKEQLGIRLLASAPDIMESLPIAQRRLYAALHPGAETISLQEVLKAAGSSYSAAKALAGRGLVEIAPEIVHRVPQDLKSAKNSNALMLTSYQQEVVSQILELLRRGVASRYLVHGVTGSGKTEVYLRLIASVLEAGGDAIFLVPEIGLTPLLSRQVVSRFPEQVALMHSGMSAGERFDQWNRIREGYSRVVVGTRSAVFAPLNNLRLIIIDEEQDASYKQDETPCYHAREVAWQRAQQCQGILLLGSATPSMETFYLATQTGEASYFCIPERIEARPMPQITLVDMSKEFQSRGKNTVVSQVLQDALMECMQRNEQAIVLLNRRGYSRTLLCRSCGHVYTCPDCSISMTYHRQENRLACHYCGKEDGIPSACANCGGHYLYYSGVGTEQLEGLLRDLLPKARIARLDRDATRRRGVLRSTLFDFAERKLDILVGTQMLAKGHDFPDVTMVGVIAADAGLSFPDFRSAERTFQLLIQVAGRAGRGTAPGRVLIQSYYPDHYALQYAQLQDYEKFYQKEIDYRKMMGYPPFRNLVQILVSDPEETKAISTAEKIASALKLNITQMLPEGRPHVLGPAAAPIEKLRGNYRMQILLKTNSASDILPVLQKCFDDLAQHKVSMAKVHIDVDPLSLL